MRHLSNLPSSSKVEPCQTQVLAVSVVGGAKASMSRTVSHFVSFDLYESKEVLRQMPWTCSSSCQKL